MKVEEFLQKVKSVEERCLQCYCGLVFVEENETIHFKLSSTHGSA